MTKQDDIKITDIYWPDVEDTDEYFNLAKAEAEKLLAQNKTNIYGPYSDAIGEEYGLRCVSLHGLHGYNTLRYESLDGVEAVKGVEKVIDDRYYNTWRARTIIKYKDMTVECDELRNKRRFIKGDIVIETSNDHGFYLGVDFFGIVKSVTGTYIDKSGIKTKFSIKDPVQLDMILERRFFTDGEKMLYNVNDIKKALDALELQKVSERLPDGTYREFDSFGRITSESLPDGKLTTWSYEKIKSGDNTWFDPFYRIYGLGYLDNFEYNHGIYAVRKVKQGNTTLFYINDGYAGKVVTTESEHGKEKHTYVYNYQDTLIEDTNESVFGLDNNHHMTVIYKTKYFDNGNKKSMETIAGEGRSIGNVIYYDPEHNGREIAHTEYKGSLIYTNDYTEDRKAMKKCFEIAMTQGNKVEANKALELIANSFLKFRPDHLSTDNSLLVLDDAIATDIKILDDGKILVGSVYEDRHWVGTTKLLRGNGIEWYWKVAAVIIDLESESCGLVAECKTPRINVRHKTDPNQDLWNKIDRDEFMILDPKTGILTVGLKMDKEHGNGWVVSKTVDVKTKIAEYDAFVAEVRAQQSPESIKSVSDKVQKFKEVSEKLNKKESEKIPEQLEVTNRGDR